MRTFKVLVIAHSLTRNRIASFDEIVSENDLTSPADELIKAGFIEEVLEEKPKAKNGKHTGSSED